METVSHFFLLFLLPILLTASPVTQDDLLINTVHGEVQGKLLSVLGGDVLAFLGIPYGKPPVGKLRFRAPEPVEGWQGVKAATKFPNSCHQLTESDYPGFKGIEIWIANTPQSEDCLYLNVWTPRFNKTQSQNPKLAPVLVWIYGGGFSDGTSSLDYYDGRYLSRSEGAVVVSMNYRTGVWGFLSLRDNENIRGNAGLLDQRLALQWVANNIAAFGGDPSMVTVFGESAGAACVGYHLLSPGSQSLFQRAVMQSGSPNAEWAAISQSVAWERAERLATTLGCRTSELADVEACLQEAEPQTMTLKQYEVFANLTITPFPFVPVVDGVFLTDKVEVLLNAGKLPKKDLLIGFNQNEGSYLLVGVPGFNITSQSLITRDEFLNGVAIVMSGAHDVTRDAIISKYTDWTDENNRMKNRDSLSSLVGDQTFACPVLDFAHRYSQHGGRTFFYYFDHRSSKNPWPAWMGVMHAFEIEFIFGLPLDASREYTRMEVNITKKMMKHWLSFARTGNPSIDGAQWTRFSPENHEYVILNHDDLVPRRMIHADKCHFWNEVVPRIEKLSDDLRVCANRSGMVLPSTSMFLLMLLAVTSLRLTE
ncbi:acetylcholinesterase-like [Brachionichthys hirsutus]|uniref:acetylcholinesterase-like n=1 Tax=Brachionichthys hirsutus TaxID=412623 RepID=UPI0036052839